MWLARIEPDQPGYDLRTFECAQCIQSEAVVIQFRYASSEPCEGREAMR